MRRLSVLALPLFAVCLDFDGARVSYCALAAQPGICGVTGGGAGGGSGGSGGGRAGGSGGAAVDAGPKRVDGGNGTDLLPEARDAGALAWGLRWGDGGHDEDPVALAVAPNSDLVLAGTLGADSTFITRFSATGAVLETEVLDGPLDVAALAVNDGGELIISGTLRGAVSLWGAELDAGTQGRAGFLARRGLDGGLSAYAQLGSADGGGASSLGRIALAGNRLAVVGSFRGDLSSGGTSLGQQPEERGMVLVFDASLSLRAWTLLTAGCDTSALDDVAIDGSNLARVFGRIQSISGGCSVGPSGISTGGADPVTHVFAVSISGLGAQSSNELTSYTSTVVTSFPVHGGIAHGDYLVGSTVGQPGSSAARYALKLGITSADVTAFESQVGAVTGRGDVGYLALNYRANDPGRIDFGGPQLPRRAFLSPVFFPVFPPDTRAPWARALEAEDAPAYARISAVTSDGAYVLAGTFSGGLGTATQLLRSSGGRDVFLLKTYPP
ncbi:MAG: hypothetical protein IPJ65_30430 [Archangiaceae bacterium]|nr:hypothetical protein [Archangiaceae bacterium]